MCKEGSAGQMTIDEAIEHALRCAADSCGECADEHRQLALWLTELRDIRKVWNNLTTAYEGACKRYNEADDGYIATVSYLYGKVARAEAENERLRELLRDLIVLPSVPAFDCYGCRYEKHHDCECGFKCKLVERARELGIEVK